ncbi:MAG: ABC transporter ATP-binding protein [Eubacterium sp.]|nr:ABC transporter ATP-binding protein [Eubacterium sp.]
MIRCEHVGKKYGSKYALQDFNFMFEPGHIYALLGPNGSGKSTLMKNLAGLIKPTEGQIYVENEPISYRHKAKIAYMPTEPYFYGYMTAMQAAKYYQDFFTDFNIDKFMFTMQRMQLDPNQKLKTYSTGMMAKFKVALNVSRNPRLLMLDEPLNGIDMLAREDVTRSIVEGISRDSAVIISSHLIEDLESISDYVLFIKLGHLVVSGYTSTFREQYGKTMSDMYREIYSDIRI